MAYGVHFEEGGESDGVAVVVSVFSLGEGGAGERFDGDDTQVRACSFDFILDEGERGSREDASSADASAEDIRVFSQELKLFFEFESDDGLMEYHVVEDGAECVVGVVVGGGIFDCFADGDA